MSKGRPTRRRADALREQRTLAERLQVWRDGLLDKRRSEKAKRAKAKPGKRSARGVDRVPDRYRVHPEPPSYVVQHTDDPYSWRRARALARGLRMPGERGQRGRLALRDSSNKPHVNPARDAKPGARLRRTTQQEGRSS